MSDSSDFCETLEVFENPSPSRNFTIQHHCPEFTSVCPKTGQPDFGCLTFSYEPDQRCVELKSLKMYLQSFRNEGIFYEAVTNQILQELIQLLSPKTMTIVAEFTPRGGLSSTITASYEAEYG